MIRTKKLIWNTDVPPQHTKAASKPVRARKRAARDILRLTSHAYPRWKGLVELHTTNSTLVGWRAGLVTHFACAAEQAGARRRTSVDARNELHARPAAKMRGRDVQGRSACYVHAWSLLLGVGSRAGRRLACWQMKASTTLYPLLASTFSGRSTYRRRAAARQQARAQRARARARCGGAARRTSNRSRSSGR